MSRLNLTVATAYYDHVADLINGKVSVDGVDLNWLTFRVEEIFFRFLVHREFDVSEVSLAKYASMVSQNDKSLVAIPVFTSRVPRHSSIFVRTDGRVRTPADLNGCRIGLPEWAQTAAVYSRGLLAHQYGVDLSSVTWIQAGVDQAGRVEKVKLNLPNGMVLKSLPEKTLSGMLIDGEIDCVLSASPPSCFREHPGIVRRLFDDVFAEEISYVRSTGIFPIMHTVAIRAEVADRNPWLAANLYAAFDEARRRSVERALFGGVSAYPIPWFYEYARQARDLFGGDLWAYGIQPNRTTLKAFLQYAYEQGVCHRLLEPEELFAPQVQRTFKA